MSTALELIGSEVLSGKSTVPSSDVLKNKKLVAFYFSAHWCPPCRQFTPLLNQHYQEWVKGGQPIEIVFVSSDQDQESFDEYFGSMAFKAIPYGDEGKRQSLGEKFGIRGIPALIVVDEQGNVKSKDGRADVMKHKGEAVSFWEKA